MSGEDAGALQRLHEEEARADAAEDRAGYMGFAALLEREGIVPYATARPATEIGDLLTQ